MNIIIPMAGEGRRFQENGYKVPKPLIEVLGKPMIQAVIENLNIDANYIFIIQKSHKQYGLDRVLKNTVPSCNIIEIDAITEGPACTALLAEKYITDANLIITNCDQITKDFEIDKLLEFATKTQAEGILGTFLSSSEKNSYVKVNIRGEVTEVREKVVISNIATTGFHFWKNGKDFVSSTKEMINAGERYNNEFYIAPTYNYLVRREKKILPFFYNLHWPVGVPEDLIKYSQFYGGS